MKTLVDNKHGASWVANVEPTPTRLAERLRASVRSAKYNASDLAATLHELGFDAGAIKDIVAALDELDARTTRMLPDMAEPTAAYEARETAKREAEERARREQEKSDFDRIQRETVTINEPGAGERVAIFSRSTKL